MADAPLTPCPKCGAPCTTKVEMRGGDHGWGTTDAERTTYRWAPSPPVAAPAGWQLAPTKSTQAMDDAGYATLPANQRHLGYEIFRVYYRAMLAAAPQPPRPGTAPLSDAQVDEVLSALIPGGSHARDWFLPHEQPRGLANVRDVVRAMLEEAARLGPTTPTPKD